MEVKRPSTAPNPHREDLTKARLAFDPLLSIRSERVRVNHRAMMTRSRLDKQQKLDSIRRRNEFVSNWLPHSEHESSTVSKRKTISIGQLSREGLYTVTPSSDAIAQNCSKRADLSESNSVHHGNEVELTGELGREVLSRLRGAGDLPAAEDPQTNEAYDLSRRYLDSWLNDFDSSAETVHPLSIALLSRLQRCSMRNDQKNLETGEGVASACEAFDICVETLKGTFPVLQEIRRSFYKALFQNETGVCAPLTPRSLLLLSESESSQPPVHGDHGKKVLPYQSRRLWKDGLSEEYLRKQATTISEFEAEVRTHKALVEASSAELAQAKCKIKELENTSGIQRDEVKVLTGQISKHERENNNLQKECNLLNQSRKELFAQVKIQETKKLAEDEATIRIHAMEEKVGVAQARAKDSEERLLKALARSQELDVRNQETTHQLALHEGKLAELQGEREREVARMKAELQKLSDQLDHHVALYNGLHERYVQAEQTMEDRQRQIDSLARDLKEAHRINEQLEREKAGVVDQFRDRLVALQTHLGEAQIANAELRRMNQVLDEERELDQANLRSKELTILELREKVAENLPKLEAEIKILLSQIEEKDQQITQHQKRLEEFESLAEESTPYSRGQELRLHDAQVQAGRSLKDQNEGRLNLSLERTKRGMIEAELMWTWELLVREREAHAEQVKQFDLAPTRKRESVKLLDETKCGTEPSFEAVPSPRNENQFQVLWFFHPVARLDAMGTKIQASMEESQVKEICSLALTALCEDHTTNMLSTIDEYILHVMATLGIPESETPSLLAGMKQFDAVPFKILLDLAGVNSLGRGGSPIPFQLLFQFCQALRCLLQEQFCTSEIVERIFDDSLTIQLQDLDSLFFDKFGYCGPYASLASREKFSSFLQNIRSLPKHESPSTQQSMNATLGPCISVLAILSLVHQFALEIEEQVHSAFFSFGLKEMSSRSEFQIWLDRAGAMGWGRHSMLAPWEINRAWKFIQQTANDLKVLQTKTQISEHSKATGHSLLPLFAGLSPFQQFWNKEPSVQVGNSAQKLSQECPRANKVHALENVVKDLEVELKKAQEAASRPPTTLLEKIEAQSKMISTLHAQKENDQQEANAEKDRLQSLLNLAHSEEKRLTGKVAELNTRVREFEGIISQVETQLKAAVESRHPGSLNSLTQALPEKESKMAHPEADVDGTVRRCLSELKRRDFFMASLKATNCLIKLQRWFRKRRRRACSSGMTKRPPAKTNGDQSKKLIHQVVLPRVEGAVEAVDGSERNLSPPCIEITGQNWKKEAQGTVETAADTKSRVENPFGPENRASYPIEQTSSDKQHARGKQIKAVGSGPVPVPTKPIPTMIGASQEDPRNQPAVQAGTGDKAKLEVPVPIQEDSCGGESDSSPKISQPTELISICQSDWEELQMLRKAERLDVERDRRLRANSVLKQETEKRKRMARMKKQMALRAEERGIPDDVREAVRHSWTRQLLQAVREYDGERRRHNVLREHALEEGIDEDLDRRLSESEEKMSTLKEQIEDYGGWRLALYRGDETLDFDFDVSPWPETDQIEVLSDLRMHLTRALQVSTKEHESSMNKCRKENYSLQRRLAKAEDELLHIRREVENRDQQLADAQEKLLLADNLDFEQLSKVLNEKGEDCTIPHLLRRLLNERRGVAELLRAFLKVEEDLYSLCTVEDERFAAQPSRKSSDMWSEPECEPSSSNSPSMRKNKPKTGSHIITSRTLSSAEYSVKSNLVQGPLIRPQTLKAVNSTRTGSDTNHPVHWRIPSTPPNHESMSAVLRDLAVSKKDVKSAFNALGISLEQLCGQMAQRVTIFHDLVQSRLIFGSSWEVSWGVFERMDPRQQAVVEKTARRINAEYNTHHKRALDCSEQLHSLLCEAGHLDRDRYEQYYLGRMANVQTAPSLLRQWAARRGQTLVDPEFKGLQNQIRTRVELPKRAEYRQLQESQRVVKWPLRPLI